MFWQMNIIETKYLNYDNYWLKEYTEKYSLDDNVWLNIYITSLYFAFTTITTVGYGDLTPINPIEITFVVTAMIITNVLFAYIFNSIGIIIQELNKDSSGYKNEMNLVTRYLEKQNIDSQLKEEAKNYLAYLFKKKTKLSTEDEMYIVDKLSTDLKEKINLQVKLTSLNSRNDIFGRFSLECLQSLAKLLKEKTFLENEIIYCQNEQDDNPCLYFIDEGAVALTSNSRQVIRKYINSQDQENYTYRNNQVQLLKEKQSFGVLSFFTNQKHAFSALPIKISKIYYLKQKEALQIIKKNPKDYEWYSFLKDTLQFNSSEQRNIENICEQCFYMNHSQLNCPVLHYQVDKEFQILKHIYQDISNRQRYLRYPYEKKCNFPFQELQKTVFNFQFMLNYVEENEIIDRNQADKKHIKLSRILNDFTSDENGASDDNQSGFTITSDSSNSDSNFNESKQIQENNNQSKKSSIDINQQIKKQKSIESPLKLKSIMKNISQNQLRASKSNDIQQNCNIIPEIHDDIELQTNIDPLTSRRASLDIPNEDDIQNIRYFDKVTYKNLQQKENQNQNNFNLLNLQDQKIKRKKEKSFTNLQINNLQQQQKFQEQQNNSQLKVPIQNLKRRKSLCISQMSNTQFTEKIVKDKNYFQEKKKNPNKYNKRLSKSQNFIQEDVKDLLNCKNINDRFKRNQDRIPSKILKNSGKMKPNSIKNISLMGQSYQQNCKLGTFNNINKNFYSMKSQQNINTTNNDNSNLNLNLLHDKIQIKKDKHLNTRRRSRSVGPNTLNSIINGNSFQKLTSISSLKKQQFIKSYTNISQNEKLEKNSNANNNMLISRNPAKKEKSIKFSENIHKQKQQNFEIDEQKIQRQSLKKQYRQSKIAFQIQLNKKGSLQEYNTSSKKLSLNKNNNVCQSQSQEMKFLQSQSNQDIDQEQDKKEIVIREIVNINDEKPAIFTNYYPSYNFNLELLYQLSNIKIEQEPSFGKYNFCLRQKEKKKKLLHKLCDNYKNNQANNALNKFLQRNQANSEGKQKINGATINIKQLKGNNNIRYRNQSSKYHKNLQKSQYT